MNQRRALDLASSSKAPMGTHSTDFAAGIVLALVSTVAGALLPIMTRYGALHVDPLLFCSGSNLVAASCVLPLLQATDGIGMLVDRRYRLRLIAISLMGTFMTGLALVYGMRRVNAISGVLLLQTEPIYSLVIATWVVGEAPSQRQVMATGLILTGVFSAFWNGGGVAMSVPAVALLVTPLMWQLSHAITLRVMPPLSPTCVTAARYGYAGLLLIALLLAIHPAALAQLGRADVLGTLLASGSLVGFVGTLSWYGAIRRLSLSWTTALVVPGIPLLSIAFAIAFLGEPATARELIAIGLAVLGVLGLVLGSDPSRKSAPIIEAIEAPVPPGI